MIFKMGNLLPKHLKMTKIDKMHGPRKNCGPGQKNFLPKKDEKSLMRKETHKKTQERMMDGYAPVWLWPGFPNSTPS